MLLTGCMLPEPLVAIGTKNGRFLIAHLCLNALHAANISSTQEFTAALEQLKASPDTSHTQKSILLEDIYRKTTTRLKGQRNDLGMRALMWVACSKRPLSFSELEQALAVQMIKDTAPALRKLPVISMNTILSACLGLITVNPSPDSIVFAHKTAHEYFSTCRDGYFPNADDEMTRMCTSMLLLYTPSAFLSLSNSAAQLERQEKSHHSHPFYFYAASHWGNHARKTKAHRDLINRFLEQEDKVDATDYVLRSSGHSPNTTIRPYRVPHPLRAIHLVAFFGLEDIFAHLPEMYTSRRKSPFPDRTWSKELNCVATIQNLTPLHYAVRGGHQGMVQLLVKSGAAVNKGDWYHVTPCGFARHYEQQDIYIFLKKHGGRTSDEMPGKEEFGLVWDLTKHYARSVDLSIIRFI